MSDLLKLVKARCPYFRRRDWGRRDGELYRGPQKQKADDVASAEGTALRLDIPPRGAAPKGPIRASARMGLMEWASAPPVTLHAAG